jgi:ABC-type iron transport system FetAB ATPase subunit
VLADDGRRAVVWITHEPVGLEHVDEIVHLPGGHADEVPRVPGDHGARHSP